MLVDSFQRIHNYLRLSITTNCNFKCSYCYTGPEKISAIKSADFQRLVRIFADMGVNKIRLTGGEPLLNPKITEYIQAIKQDQRIHTLGITTNGVLIKRYMPDFIQYNVNNLNISLDSLVPEKFEFITRINGFKKVMEGIYLAIDNIPSVKLNCVVLKGFNDDELIDFVTLAKDLPLTIRFIEFMPFTGNHWEDKRFLPMQTMIDTINTTFPLHPASDNENISTNYTIEGFKGKIGFIPTISQPFCESCNRIRITADGFLKVCLHDDREIQLDTQLSDDELKAVIVQQLLRKKFSHDPVNELLKNKNRPMKFIGGQSCLILI